MRRAFFSRLRASGSIRVPTKSCSIYGGLRKVRWWGEEGYYTAPIITESIRENYGCLFGPLY